MNLLNLFVCVDFLPSPFSPYSYSFKRIHVLLREKEIEMMNKRINLTNSFSFLLKQYFSDD